MSNAALSKKICCVKNKLDQLRIPVSYWQGDPAADPVELTNPSFEDLTDAQRATIGTGASQLLANTIPGWESTDPRIEVWASGFQGVPAFDGNYFIEMNPGQPARTFQRLSVPQEAGIINWSVAHRGRPNAANPTGLNRGEVIIAQDGVDEVVQVMETDATDWVVYSGSKIKQCGVSEIEIAFNSLDVGSFGNFLDDIKLEYIQLDISCNIGYVDCEGNIFPDADSTEPLDQSIISLCDPSCVEATPFLVSADYDDLNGELALTLNNGDQVTTTIATARPLAAYNVTGDGNGAGGTLTLTAVRQDPNWVDGTFTGTPDRVLVTAQVAYLNDVDNAAIARIAPQLELLRNGVLLAVSATGYQRHSTQDHKDSSNTISFIDPTPGTNPTYELRTQQGSTPNQVLPVSVGTIQLEATL